MKDLLYVLTAVPRSNAALGESETWINDIEGRSHVLRHRRDTQMRRKRRTGRSWHLSDAVMPLRPAVIPVSDVTGPNWTDVEPSKQSSRERTAISLSELNACLCGQAANPQLGGVIQCKHHLECLDLHTAPRNWGLWDVFINSWRKAPMTMMSCYHIYRCAWLCR